MPTRIRKNQLNILSWNIRGVSSRRDGFKLDDVDVMSLLTKYDIVGLTETHTVEEHEKLSAFKLNGY